MPYGCLRQSVTLGLKKVVVVDIYAPVTSVRIYTVLHANLKALRRLTVQTSTKNCAYHNIAQNPRFPVIPNKIATRKSFAECEGHCSFY